jgi:hypothetical protein
MILITLTLLLFSCDTESKQTIIDDYMPQLQTINTTSRAWAEREGLSATTEPDWDRSVDDAGTFDGILCYSGEDDSRKAIEASQGHDGRMWRAPAHIGTSKHYSRDAATGQLACFIKTRNATQLGRWVRYLSANDWRLCPELSNCEMNSASPLWSIFYYALQREGLSIPRHIEERKDAHTLMLTSAQFAKGYQLHILALQASVLEYMGVSKSAVRETFARRYPENPFFQFVAGESRKSAELTVKYCPLSKPSVRSDWIWQRDEIISDKSSGWDCIAITNLLL